MPNVHPMGCGTSTDSVNTGNVSPQPSDYYIDRATAISRNNLVSTYYYLIKATTTFGASDKGQKGLISLIVCLHRIIE